MASPTPCKQPVFCETLRFSTILPVIHIFINTVSPMKQALIIFAKVPVPGGVKTRLIPPLEPQQEKELDRIMAAAEKEFSGKK